LTQQAYEEPVMQNRAITTVSIQGTDLQRVEYKGETVVTFAQVDEVHERPNGTAGRNFRDNRKRFHEGKDYVRICADEIRRHKIIPLSSKAREDVIFLTKRGYLKLVKPMNDDRAWEVQGEMIDRYFMVEEIGLANVQKMVGSAREARLWLKQGLSIARMAGLSGNYALLSANQLALKATGFDVLEAMGSTHITSDEQEPVLTPTLLAERGGYRSGQAVNQLFTDKGFQIAVKDKKGKVVGWEPTEKGRQFAVWQDTGKRHGNGTPIHQLKWRASILDAVGAETAH